MDEFRIDSHKLIYHIDRLYQWLQGKDIFPIYVEISPIGMCNHRCIFCAFDYLGYKPRYIEKDYLFNVFKEMAKCGVKSVMYSGEGEPLLHKDIVELVSHTKKAGMDVSLTTNGVLLNKEIAHRLLESLTWIRISINAGTPKTYALIHQCRPEDFTLVLDSLKYVVKVKQKNNYDCTIGTQLLLLENNYNEVAILVKRLRDLGVDYLIIKPYSWHPKSKNRMKIVEYRRCLELNERLQKFSDNNFKIIFRMHTMQKLREDKPYKYCLGLPFWTYIDSQGDIYACSTFLGDKRFCYGNIYKNNFKEIWKGKKRKQILNMFSKKFDIRQCRRACRLDEINRYLWELKYPPLHVNFI